MKKKYPTEAEVVNIFPGRFLLRELAEKINAPIGYVHEKYIRDAYYPLKDVGSAGKKRMRYWQVNEVYRSGDNPPLNSVDIRVQ